MRRAQTWGPGPAIAAFEPPETCNAAAMHTQLTEETRPAQHLSAGCAMVQAACHTHVDFCDEQLKSASPREKALSDAEQAVQALEQALEYERQLPGAL